MSEAVTRRARMVMRTGDDDLSPEDGVDSILTMLPNRAVRIGYLLDLYHSEFGDKFSACVLTALLDMVNLVSSLNDLLPAGSSSGDIIEAVGDLRHRIGDNALGEEISALISKKLDSMMSPDVSKATEAPRSASASSEPPKRKRKGDSKRVYPPGDIIFREGDPGDEAFMILSGEIEISTQPGETRTVLAALGRGEIFGEMALVDNQPRMATATATQETTVSVMPQEIFKKRLSWLAEEDRLISHVMEVFVTRLRQQGAP